MELGMNKNQAKKPFMVKNTINKSNIVILKKNM